jgi:uncharacterized membrane protein YozB (DUF420 family)
MVSYLEVAQINLGLQISLLFLLILSYLIKRRGKFFAHGSIMLVAVVLNAVSFLLVMGPSLLSLGETVLARASDKLSVVIIAHASLGALAEVLGIWIVGSWRLRSGTEHCVRTKRLMLATFVVWLAALSLGVLLYTLLYTDLLR